MQLGIDDEKGARTRIASTPHITEEMVDAAAAMAPANVRGLGGFVIAKLTPNNVAEWHAYCVPPHKRKETNANNGYSPKTFAGAKPNTGDADDYAIPRR